MKSLANTTIANIRVGNPEVKQDAPAHIHGVQEGNHPDPLTQEPGIYLVANNQARGTARRSTGINPEAHNPIHPDMPNLSPA